jgi:hypothetical protein
MFQRNLAATLHCVTLQKTATLTFIMSSKITMDEVDGSPEMSCTELCRSASKYIGQAI